MFSAGPCVVPLCCDRSWMTRSRPYQSHLPSGLALFTHQHLVMYVCGWFWLSCSTLSTLLGLYLSFLTTITTARWNLKPFHYSITKFHVGWPYKELFYFETTFLHRRLLVLLLPFAFLYVALFLLGSSRLQYNKDQGSFLNNVFI